MLLAIDVGNTDTKLGCFAEGESELSHAWRIRTNAKRTADELGTLFVQLFATHAGRLTPGRARESHPLRSQP